MGNLLTNLPVVAMAHPYTISIIQASVYGTFTVTFTDPMSATTLKLQPNRKRFSATHTIFLFHRVM